MFCLLSIYLKYFVNMLFQTERFYSNPLSNVVNSNDLARNFAILHNLWSKVFLPHGSFQHKMVPSILQAPPQLILSYDFSDGIFSPVNGLTPQISSLTFVISDDLPSLIFAHKLLQMARFHMYH